MSRLSDQLLLELLAAGLPEPEREYHFAPIVDGKPIRKWRFDLAWPHLLLACEIEGGIWVGGRHVRAAGYERDCEKYSEAVVLGWHVLRVTGKMISDGYAIDVIKRALEACRPESIVGEQKVGK